MEFRPFTGGRIRVIVADHVPVFSHGLAALPQRTEDISVVEDLFLLELLVSGAPQADIARRLIVSESTLKRKFADLQMRLGATNRFDAVARAARSGLI